MEVTYRMQNGYQVPNLLMPQAPEVHLGKYAELRREYLKKHRRVLYTNLKTSGALVSIWQRSSRPRGRWWSRPWRRWHRTRA